MSDRCDYDYDITGLQVHVCFCTGAVIEVTYMCTREALHGICESCMMFYSSHDLRWSESLYSNEKVYCLMLIMLVHLSLTAETLNES